MTLHLAEDIELIVHTELSYENQSLGTLLEILGLTKNNNNLPLPPSSDEVDTATLLNITDVNIDSLVVEEKYCYEEASITKRIPLKYKSLCLSEMPTHNIQHPTFQRDVKGQTRWDGLVIDILVKHWLYAKNKEAFQEYPLQSDFCTKTIVSAIVEQWLRGQKASYAISKPFAHGQKLLGCETASQIIPHMNCISDTEKMKIEIYFALKVIGVIINILYSLHLLDTNTICSIRDRKGNNAANRCLESHRIIARNDSDQTPAQGYHLIAILKNSLMVSTQPTNYHLVFKNHVCNLINTYFQ
ncbi:hypothetical protein PPACK8108_LOCUS15012 [Phakopsora pachyrhizi]|uniref:Uncharacterized protein n=1 Tax=Phakopsora pachyrhizi TaxID=170000 RepID=A0AAV0B868_PHAPC|nr:hypothetical protein PPACK8108_LOCUS15012 [Phakopsora pachyrhizi]